jgi:hypothetical protein
MSDTVEGAEQRLINLETRLAALEAENRSLQRVKDVQEIQNVFSMHEYYHMAGRHGDEVNAIWATKTPGLAMEEAVLNGRYEGLEAVRGYYVEWFDRCFFGVMRQAMRELYPEVDPGPDEGVPFGVRIVHTLTTPVIEVAEDRQTAKAVWISPGYISAPAGGKLSAMWHWDRYAIDFAHEDTGWKIWHLWVGKDFSTPYEHSWVDDFFAGPNIDLRTIPDFPEPNAPSVLSYEGYNPYTRAQLVPQPPVPYRTFSETFSY